MIACYLWLIWNHSDQSEILNYCCMKSVWPMRACYLFLYLNCFRPIRAFELLLHEVSLTNHGLLSLTYLRSVWPMRVNYLFISEKSVWPIRDCSLFLSEKLVWPIRACSLFLYLKPVWSSRVCYYAIGRQSEYQCFYLFINASISMVYQIFMNEMYLKLVILFKYWAVALMSHFLVELSPTGYVDVCCGV